MTVSNGQLGDVAIFEDLVSLERSVVIGDIRFLIGLRSIADINTKLTGIDVAA